MFMHAEGLHLMQVLVVMAAVSCPVCSNTSSTSSSQAALANSSSSRGGLLAVSYRDWLHTAGDSVMVGWVWQESCSAVLPYCCGAALGQLAVALGAG